MNLQEFAKQFDFSGRTVVMTGATGVLGGEIASALASCGASVAVIGRRVDAADELLERLGDAATRVAFVRGDVTDRASMEAAARQVVQRFGKVDALVNGAGGNHPEATTRPDKPFFDIPPEALRAVIDLNVLGTILPSQVFGRLMAERGGGVILNISSVNAFRPPTRNAAYSGAKAAVSNFTQWLAVHMAQEYSPRIRVNAIAPGFFLARQNRFLLIDEQTGELTARGRAIIAHTPAGRFGDPSDLVGATLWLLSPASSFVTGVVLPVDGGFTAFSGV